MPHIRIKTSGALRSVDNWKARLVQRYRRYLVRISILIYSISGSEKPLVMCVPLILGLSVHFATFAFGSVLVLGFTMLRLYSYRFANIILRLGAGSRMGRASIPR